MTGPFALLAALLAAPAPAAPAVVNDVEFAAAGGERLYLDVAVPPGPGPFPAVLALHGGAWRFGSRRDLSRPNNWYELGTGPTHVSLIETVAAHGFVVASASYRLCPKHKFPAQVVDAKTAIRFLRANADRFKLDPKRVAVMGFSAGGHIAALAGFTTPADGFDGPLYPAQSSQVQAVVDFFGPAELDLYAATPGIELAYFKPLLGTTSAANPAAFKRASPIAHVSKDDPPTLIVHGTADPLVPIIHSERLHAKLTAAGVPAEFVQVRGKGHGWGGEAALDSTKITVDFLTARLKAR